MPKEKASALDNVRHSLAHLLAAAVLKRHPDAKLGIGPTIADGFYYDIQFRKPFSADELAALEKDMRDLVRLGLPFKGQAVTPAQAKKLFKGQPFKLDLIKEFAKGGRKLTVYRTGDVFLDLCRGGHVKNTKEIDPESFKLSHLAGAYWRGDEKNAQLTRIYGLAFASKKELDTHLQMIEEAKRRDHRKLGQELKLFVNSELVGPGLPLYTPRGTTVLMEIKDFSRALRREIGYQEVQTPQINKAQLFKTSGHYDKYKDDMFPVRSHYSEEEYFLKPMNCPQHTQIYASEGRSYKDLPVRLADFSLLYRDEKPGELSGLTRLRSFSQDDGHCFCREDQIAEEFDRLLGVITKALRLYGMDYYIRLSLRDEKNKSAYLGGDAVWKKSQKILEDLLRSKKVEYVRAPGEAAFYGPKMDFIAKDSLGREWQISTIQIDFNQPERFSLEYVAESGKKARPIMIHAALVGSPERFLAVLLEHYAGAFPLWLSPVQAAVLPVGEKFEKYAEQVLAGLREQGIRAELSRPDESLGKRIRGAEMQKVPYILVVGEKEEQARSVNVRHYRRGQEGELGLEKLAEKISAEIREKVI